ncbi:hypothetical protein DVH24_002541 [Malus domestica]|uniref:AB hydrolase-1 domain-containing protein n=1 Tax=Malus domestica TaxID=3750 RepID=A0A498IVM8_MALDO|nr:hypothetical protein DVH24_002541 [Malus domestica]
MEQLQHKYITVQGLKLHVVDIGTGHNIFLPTSSSVRRLNVIVFLHGFPEIWYSWRHQMIGLAPLRPPSHCSPLQRIRTLRPASPTRQGLLPRPHQ